MGSPSLLYDLAFGDARARGSFLLRGRGRAEPAEQRSAGGEGREGKQRVACAGAAIRLLHLRAGIIFIIVAFFIDRS